MSTYKTGFPLSSVCNSYLSRASTLKAYYFFKGGAIFKTSGGVFKR